MIPDTVGTLSDGAHYGGGRTAKTPIPGASLCLNAGGMGRLDSESETLIPTIGGGFDVADPLKTRGGNHAGQDVDGKHGNLVVAPCLTQNYGKQPDSSDTSKGPMLLAVAHSPKADGFDASEDGTGRGTPLTLAIRGRGDSHDLEYRQDGTANAILTPNGGRGGIGVGAIAIQGAATRENVASGPDGVGVRTDGAAYTLEARSEVQAIAFDCKASGQNGFGVGDIAATMRSMGHASSHQNGGGHQAVAFDLAQITSKTNRSRAEPGLPVSTLNADSQMHMASVMQVRRLTPLECERLQGFPDGWTDIPYNGKPAKDGPRYKALGNSMAVNVMSWIGRRIQSVESIP